MGGGLWVGLFQGRLVSETTGHTNFEEFRLAAEGVSPKGLKCAFDIAHFLWCSMHRFPTQSSVFRCRFAALLFIFRWLSPVVGFPILVWAMAVDDLEWFMIGLVVVVALPVVIVVQWIVASRVRCPLCLTPPLLDRRCSKNQKATQFLFSYRLNVALSALFLGRFRCPYCGEPTVMKSRRR